MDKTPRGMYLHSQAKEIIYNTFKYFDLEKQQGGPVTDVKKTMCRTAEATKVSLRTVCHICKEVGYTEELFEKT